jgi:N-acetylmuramoyl-L-alanine amidase
LWLRGFIMLTSAALPILLATLAAATGEAPFVVALDAGHGGSNRGAPTARTEVFEKHLTLEIARMVQARLQNEPGLKVVLCRAKDMLVPIRARTRCANQAGARLFVSIHANAASVEQGPGSQRGFEIFVSPTADVDLEVAQAALLAEDEVQGAWAGHQARTRAEESLAAARRFRWRLADSLGSDRDRGIKQLGATLDILQGLNMPGILVELGFLDHAEEGPFLLSDEGKKLAAQALAGAITDLRGREQRGQRDSMITAPKNQRRSTGTATSTDRQP